MKLSGVLFLDNAQFNRAAATSRGQIGALTGGIGRTIAPLAAFAGGFLSAAGALLAFNKAKNEAAEFEDFEASFVTLLGSEEAAMARMKELADFGKTTPFELPGVVKASKILESLTQGALSTGAGLTMVGDVSANANQPIEELAVHIGRLYDGLKTGRAVGESLQRLQELGLISGQTRTEIEKLQKEGAAGEQVWGVAQKALGRFSGEMERRSRTWNGMMSNFKDGVDAAFRAFGAPVIDALKPALAEAIGDVGEMEASAERFGNKVADGIRLITAAFEDNSVGGLFAQGLLVAGAKFLNQISLGWEGIIRGAIGAFKEGFLGVFETFKLGMLSFGSAWAAIILGAIEDGLRKVGLSDRADAVGEARARAESNAVDSAELSKFRASSILPLMQKAFEDGMADASGILQFDTTGLERELQGRVDFLKGLTPDSVADPEGSATKPASPSDAVASGTGGFQQITADRLARIGGFVGGTSPTTDHARRTADNTRRTNQLLEKNNNLLTKLSQRNPAAMGAVWAT